MKRLFYCLVLCILVFASCNKESDLLIDSMDNFEAVKAQLTSVIVPSSSELTTLFVGNTSGPTLKAAKILSIVNIYPLAQETYEVGYNGDEVVAMKGFAYFELSSNSDKLETVTIKKNFVVKDGKIDPTSYWLTYTFECPFPLFKVFSINTRGAGYIQKVTCMFTFNDGRRFSYNVYTTENGIRLPNLADGKWEIEVETYDGYDHRILTTGSIDFASSDTELFVKIKTKETNIVSQCIINTSKLVDVRRIRFFSEDPQTGDIIFIDIPFRFDSSLQDNVLFDLPFFPTSVAVMSDTFCHEYLISGFQTMIDGKLRYFLSY